MIKSYYQEQTLQVETLIKNKKKFIDFGMWSKKNLTLEDFWRNAKINNEKIKS